MALGKAIGGACVYIWRKSKVVAFICLAILVIAIGLIVDSIAHHDHIYDGVKIGTVDVSGMTRAEAAKAVDDAYLDNLFATNVYIFANETIANSADIDSKLLEDEALAEQVSFEEAQKDKELWVASAKNLEASLPAEELAQEAYEVGRESGFLDRFAAAASGKEVPIRAEYNEDLLNQLMLDINSILGDPIQEYGVKVEDGVASVTEGHDGSMMDANEFIAELDRGLLSNDQSKMSFVADVKYTPLKIDEAAAQATCDAINAVIADGVSFIHEGKPIDVSRETLGSWVRTDVTDAPRGKLLAPSIDESVAMKGILEIVTVDRTRNEDVPVDIVKEGDEIIVKPRSDVQLPAIEEDLVRLDEALFSNYRQNGEATLSGSVNDIPINSKAFKGSLSLEDALTYGVVEEISSYTTKFVNTKSTANRAYNIHHVADIIDESIVESDGGQWSFNNIAGSCDEEAGFKEAGVMESGEMTTGAGGGICQVATTVFNCVYDSGLPINERHNHSLRTSSYPDGRDAAIAYPTLDLIWTNSTSSDIVLLTDYTDTSVTVRIIGTKPDLTVETEVGEWIEGEKYKTKFEVDEDLSKDKSYLKSNGTDGMAISVVRTVKDASGNIIETDTFTSDYLPVNKVIAYGKGSDLAAIKEKYPEEEDS